MTTATMPPPAPTWDLDSLFPKGSKSDQFKKFKNEVKTSIDKVEKELVNLPDELDSNTQGNWAEFVLEMQSIIENIELVLAFSGCLASADVNDAEASSSEAEGDLFYSNWNKIMTGFESKAMAASDSEWEKFVSLEEIAPIRFYLDETRELARKKMSVEKESLLLDLSVDGYHTWGRLYNKMAGDLRVTFEGNSGNEELSLGQLATKLSDPDRKIRKQAFEKMTTAWESRADLASMTLNALGGFRLTTYKLRGWDSLLFEPLKVSRLSREALDAMWSVIGRENQRLVPYIEAKKKLLGIDKYRWYDEFAPCGKVEKQYSYDEAADFIVRHTANFSTDLSEFCKKAIDKRWVEAEDRAGKRGGGFCTPTGPRRESRIFMTYANSYENLLTLAHELGHAYHGHVLKNTSYLATGYPMTLAETASIFSELLVTDAALNDCNDPQEKLMLLDQKLQQPYVFFCDIYTRFTFEKAFYAERAKGIVGKDRLNELMIEAQKTAFGSLLDESGYHPLFWASKLHFYITETPFYNFPYTFGFLFAGGVYDRACKEGSAFAPKYADLLRDSGSMSTDDAAMKHLGIDIKKEDFWIDAVNRSLADVDEFVRLADQIK